MALSGPGFASRRTVHRRLHKPRSNLDEFRIEYMSQTVAKRRDDVVVHSLTKSVPRKRLDKHVPMLGIIAESRFPRQVTGDGYRSWRPPLRQRR
jgi:hypothetical protein